MENANTPLVSVVVRTLNRPALAMQAVRSVLEQSYKRTEVILVEDGPPNCKPFVDRIADGRLTYLALGRNFGRSIAGNEGLARARGIYFNFLDDDDFLYPWHIETLVDALKERESVVYAGWEVVSTKWLSLEPLKYREFGAREKFLLPYNKFSLWVSNFIPIQAVMFHRSYFDELGGLDPELNAFEDWELWCRYSTRGEFHFIPRITSLVRSPHNRTSKIRRSAGYEQTHEAARQKVEELPFLLDRFDRDTFVKFAEHYAHRHKFFKVSRKVGRLLQRFHLSKKSAGYLQ